MVLVIQAFTHNSFYLSGQVKFKKKSLQRALALPLVNEYYRKTSLSGKQMISIRRDPIAHCGPAQILLVGVDITAQSFHSIFRIYLTSCFLFLVPGCYCLHLAHTRRHSRMLAKSCQHPWMLSTWSVASPVIGLFLYLKACALSSIFLNPRTLILLFIRTHHFPGFLLSVWASHTNSDHS